MSAIWRDILGVGVVMTTDSGSSSELENLERYQQLREEAHQAYAQLSPSEAKRALPVAYWGGIFAILCAVAFIAWLWVSLSGPSTDLSLTVFPSAFAAKSPPAPAPAGIAQERHFTPPLGLSQGAFSWIVIGMVVFAGGFVSALLYKGFFSPHPSEVAAHFVLHTASGLVGGIVGTLLGTHLA
jgi:hypothetical protein